MTYEIVMLGVNSIRSRSLRSWCTYWTLGETAMVVVRADWCRLLLVLGGDPPQCDRCLRALNDIPSLQRTNSTANHI
jgi:hypothetical protein